jgi:hypothetical protein
MPGMMLTVHRRASDCREEKVPDKMLPKVHAPLSK